MGLTVEDGTGKGFQAKVNSTNQVAVASTIVTKEHEINHQDGQAYSVPVSLTPTGAGDCFLYLKNNSDLDLIVAELAMTADTTETFTMKLGDEGTPIGGNAVTPVNRNAGSGNQADITVVSGVDITGLSGGASPFGWQVEGGTGTHRVAPASGFIVPKNKVLTMYVTTGGIPIRFGLGITFHNADY